MTVKELNDILQTLPQDYEMIYESSSDAFGSSYLACVDDVEVNDKDKVVILKEF